ncbi:MAG: SpoIIE family protein phosphatase [Rhodospirillales bacterium]|nr:MAG: SpoIIE family protein phosphatase [Rhodospirillales bacterium]
MAGVGFYVLISASIDEFADRIIRENLSAYARVVEEKVDAEIDRCNAEGVDCLVDPQRTFHQVAVFEGFEDFARQNELGIAVHDLAADRMLFADGIPDDEELLAGLGCAQDAMVGGLEGRTFFAQCIDINLWQWRIILLKDSRVFSLLTSRVRTFYLTAGVAVLLLAGLLAIYLRRAIAHPINQLVGRFREQQPPDYKGITEFEFLSDNIGQMMRELAAHRDKLEELVAIRTAEADEARTRLTDALESISEGFSLYGTDDRLVLCNTRYREVLYPGISDLARPGTPFETIIRRAAERGLVKTTDGDNDAWISQRLARHCDPGEPHLQQRKDGRWIQVSERKTADGGTVAVYTDVTEIKRAAERMEEELRAARELQLSILPKQFAADGPKRPLRFAAEWQPAAEVSGDFFGVIEVDDHRTGVVIGDATGHDVRAALLMARTFTILTALAKRGATPGTVLAQVNNALCPGNDSMLFTTVFYGVFDARTRRLTFANAGHNPPYVLRSARSVEQLAVSGDLVMGIKPDLSYAEDTVDLARGDTLFCYTDGIPEAKNTSMEQFSEANLEMALSECLRLPVEDVVAHVTEKVNDFTDSAPRSDDVTCIAMQYMPDDGTPHSEVSRSD